MKAALLGVCLALAADADAPPVFVPVQHFTLAWEHSIEKVRWEEDYEVIEQHGKPTLKAGEARIQGSAAGMEPPPDAVRQGSWYRYQPDSWPHAPLRLTRSEYTPDYEWCVDGACQPLSALLPTDGDITLLSPCQRQP